MRDPTMDELLEEAKPLGFVLKKFGDNKVNIKGIRDMNRREFECWIARTRVAQALKSVDGM